MYAIGEVSRRSGVNIETIRYYEREGILPAPGRTRGGRRIYDEAGLSRLRFIKRCRDLGFSMAEAKALLALATRGGMTCGQAKPIAERHLASVEEKLREIQRLQAALSELIGQCADELDECPILRGLLDD